MIFHKIFKIWLPFDKKTPVVILQPYLPQRNLWVWMEEWVGGLVGCWMDHLELKIGVGQQYNNKAHTRIPSLSHTHTPHKHTTNSLSHLSSLQDGEEKKRARESHTHTCMHHYPSIHPSIIYPSTFTHPQLFVRSFTGGWSCRSWPPWRLISGMIPVSCSEPATHSPVHDDRMNHHQSLICKVKEKRKERKEEERVRTMYRLTRLSALCKSALRSCSSSMVSRLNPSPYLATHREEEKIPI